ncbi:MAG TPA: extracellular solute-binding protein [Acidimicrobiales bacterium]|nr:extracellular solute-binding protein [Acidimicrobiales bacterium]
MSRRLRVALVGGPMYDDVYRPFIDDVEIVVRGDHLTLNARVAELLAAGERIDVLSTHGKYAPSQSEWLHPLDDLLAPESIAALAPGAVALCRDRGELLCAPRNIDVRVLWWRADRSVGPPDTWEAACSGESTFGFTGRGSGLFGLFYELVVGAGGRLFDEEGRPALDRDTATDAAATIVALGARCPEATSWHYDEVDATLAAGRVDAAAAWPGATSLLRASPAGPHLRAAPYPTGPVRRVSYSGCHGWAIPRTCGDLDAAVALVEQLCSAETHRIEASLGGIPARTDVLEAINAIDAVDAERLDVTRRTIAESMITYPALARFPLLEDTGAAALGDLLSGTADRASAVEVIRTALAAVAG